MKKLVCILLSAAVFVLLLTGCGADTSKWQTNDTFAAVPVYEYGDTLSAVFSTEANIKIADNSYDNFVKYIEQLKLAGFEYLKNGDVPENYSLNDGSASWRCSNGELYLQLIFSQDGTSSRDMFGCNLQIYGYSSMPESWKTAQTSEQSAEKESEQESSQGESNGDSAAQQETKGV